MLSTILMLRLDSRQYLGQQGEIPRGFQMQENVPEIRIGADTCSDTSQRFPAEGTDYTKTQVDSSTCKQTFLHSHIQTARYKKAGIRDQAQGMFSPAIWEAYICIGSLYAMHTPMVVVCLNSHVTKKSWDTYTLLDIWMTSPSA